MKKDRKISVTQIVTYVITLAIIGYILFSVISTSLAGRITKLQNDVYAQNSAVYQKSTHQATKDNAKNNLLAMTASVDGNKLREAKVALTNATGFIVQEQVSLPDGNGNSNSYEVDFELLFYAYSTSNDFTKPDGYIGFVADNSTNFQKSDAVLTLTVKQPGKQDLNLVLTSPEYDKTKAIVGSKSTSAQTFLLSSNDLNSIVVEANVSSVNANTVVPVLYTSSNKALAEVYTNKVVTNYALNKKLKSLDVEDSDTAQLDSKYKLSNYNGGVALNTVLVVIVSLVIVYIFFIHKYVKAAIAKKKQQKKEVKAAEEEVQEADFVEEETETKEEENK